ncbi:MAG: response regulator transcription factor [Floccifex porci]|uniref:Response regulator transcription factor n=1 Tax=Floccifex porci TaxID=2606629 RepID=A0A7X2N347_9FIRM|nr:response regulator transcription factor [Floccifex porci]MCI7803427.1 response regulator transcription factor [Erysipelotrichaceae bacterium]MDD7466488.1 response regulator transcription factor [Floccifex porci]MDO4479744.1 response regulator transcription factor [Erysipelotrichaceae bacterium]MDY4796826.1 response regulator transcription factor [Floccifex porci]MSS01103.1 response regulator transcription factor [Floccifex porci]
MTLIYIVEDDDSISEIEMIALKNCNYDVKRFDRSSVFLKKLEETLPDLVLLDIMLPDENGYEVVKKIRKNPVWRKLPIIMVSAKSTEIDMVRGLDEGADDYIKKPFSIMELISRVKALLRRTQDKDPVLLKVNDITLDYTRHLVYVKDEPVELTYKEFELLRYLMINVEVVLSRDAIMRVVWDTDFEGESRTVDMHIKTLRQKLKESGKNIKTIRNVGYVLQRVNSNETEN